ncbi:3-deoxy-7-phosphoheptulonate synthase [Krasilnikovia sp. M28-CT-15]|uniref:3-deoxy-7-phosphoheptulonate synthase n=1 Tax=Krasilnikovia sp. M28-CT-15 TaxID=3373540 RepID=UPI0038770E80
MLNTLLDVQTAPSPQQPDWKDSPHLRRVKEDLALRPALVAAADVRRLRSLLAQASTGEIQVVQAGDCAENPAECTPDHVLRKAGLLDLLAGALKIITQAPVLRVGRMAGQFAKPRSRPTEMVHGRELPVYRGHMVNRPEPDPDSRRPDPRHLLTGYAAASEAMTHLGWLNPVRRSDICPQVWTSHEALLLDYEVPMLRRDEDGRSFLGSTHWPWIGDRTRQVDGAHVAMMAEVMNPVACKVGPSMTADELVALCDRLDPWREPGRLTLIARMGVDRVGTHLPPLVRAVRAAGHPVIWLSDPMHGNTVSASGGHKTRYLQSVIREVREFQVAVRSSGGVAGGLHLETTPDDVLECVADESAIGLVGDRYTTLCDPRLNPEQALAVASAWQR